MRIDGDEVRAEHGVEVSPTLLSERVGISRGDIAEYVRGGTARCCGGIGWRRRSL